MKIIDVLLRFLRLQEIGRENNLLNCSGEYLRGGRVPPRQVRLGRQDGLRWETRVSLLNNVTTGHTGGNLRFLYWVRSIENTPMIRNAPMIR